MGFDQKEFMNKRRNAFTLIEILVVLAIIALLAALLFPAFNRAKESSRQTNCASNLQQIGFAVAQYRKDEGRYPDSLVDILGEGAKYNAAGTTGTLGSNAPGYLKGGSDVLLCLDDDTLADVARSSYGFLSKGAPTTALPTGQIDSTFTGDLSQFVWNYWGTRDDGFTFATPSLAAMATPLTAPPAGGPPENLLLVSPQLPYYHRNFGINPAPRENVLKYSLSNRFAPPTTIITHCIYHRLPTANNINNPGELYGPAPVDSANVKDIVLRVDGSAKAIDVSKWKTATPATNVWQTQTQ